MTPDSIAALPELSCTELYRAFRAEPLGFADVGSLGGVHPVVLPIASLVHALCFEPDGEGYAALEAKYATPAPFARVSLQQIALGAENAAAVPLYVSSTPTNTSLLKPNPRFIGRYKAEKFRLSHVAKVDTRTLDSIVFAGAGGPRAGEFLKLDTQGSEHDILRGAGRTLAERTVAVLCEVEFFEVYEGQKTLADIVCLLREHGLVLYAIYPHYRSAGLLDRRRYETEERLMWADAVFFKDPFDDMNRERPLSKRERQALILASLVLGFFDFALELLAANACEADEREALERAIKGLAAGGRERLLADFARLAQTVSGADGYLELRRFIESNRSSSSTEHLWAQLSTARGS